MPENSQRIESLPIMRAGARADTRRRAGARGGAGAGLPRARRTHAHHTDTVTDSSHTPAFPLAQPHALQAVSTHPRKQDE